MSRRRFLQTLGWGAFGLSLSGCLGRKTEEKPNLLLLTADDMNYDSPGCYGCRIPDITPNIDRLAAEGMKFEQAHVNISVCQPCRQSLLTGRYAVRHGGEGFHPIRDDVPTLVEELKKFGIPQRNSGQGKALQTGRQVRLGLCRRREGSGFGTRHRPEPGAVSRFRPGILQDRPQVRKALFPERKRP